MLDVLILAAGRGERLRPLTDYMPKALLRVGTKSLLEHHLLRLKAQGFKDVVINLAWLGEQIRQHIGDGARFGLRIRYSDEADDALETGGGIVQALPLLQSDPFIVMNGDILCDFECVNLRVPDQSDMHLVVVPNPPHHPQGDFALQHGQLIRPSVAPNSSGNPLNWTYAGIGCFRRAIFTEMKPERFPLFPIIERAIADNSASAEIHHGQWLDVGTAERLEQARQQTG